MRLVTALCRGMCCAVPLPSPHSQACKDQQTTNPPSQITWAGRLVNSSKLLSLREQKALLALAAEGTSGPQ